MARAGSQVIDTTPVAIHNQGGWKIAVWVLTTATIPVKVRIDGMHDSDEWVTLSADGVRGLEFEVRGGQLGTLWAKTDSDTETLYWGLNGIGG